MAARKPPIVGERPERSSSTAHLPDPGAIPRGLHDYPNRSNDSLNIPPAGRGVERTPGWVRSETDLINASLLQAPDNSTWSLVSQPTNSSVEERCNLAGEDADQSVVHIESEQSGAMDERNSAATTHRNPLMRVLDWILMWNYCFSRTTRAQKIYGIARLLYISTEIGTQIFSFIELVQAVTSLPSVAEDVLLSGRDSTPVAFMILWYEYNFIICCLFIIQYSHKCDARYSYSSRFKLMLNFKAIILCFTSVVFYIIVTAHLTYIFPLNRWGIVLVIVYRCTFSLLCSCTCPYKQLPTIVVIAYFIVVIVSSSFHARSVVGQITGSNPIVHPSIELQFGPSVFFYNWFILQALATVRLIGSLVSHFFIICSNRLNQRRRPYNTEGVISAV